ncbi:MAG TPA: tRNA (adenosine(37)-N6)-threonylcarbamoyltransferase complex transferase subunit TsaD [Candidatus Saccharimonadales bacterium]|nr:tRNA (adenosine(37)-N6)-threonylcarbamoyltransferase complex transferase subunit TsaD [Candidatus Saccharimonadales bacterium]
MIILGIESSCDETAVGIVQDGQTLLANVVNSQIDIHKVYGGVVPEVAARSHIEVVIPVIQEALDQATLSWDDIDGIAVTYGPGLVGSLLIGSLTARTLATLKQKPLYAINHVEAHIYANFITAYPASLPSPAPGAMPQFPMLALIVSGGHSQLALFEDHFNYRLLGQTQDDAIGEAFDKVAKIIGLPYPGGPSIAAAAAEGNAQAFTFPKAHMSNPYDFSFSGLKTAVLRRVQQVCDKGYDFPSTQLAALLSASQRNDIAASFQRIAIETVVDKTVKAYNEFGPKSVVIAGGVAANQELRRQLSERLPFPIEYAAPKLCTDNGAMIAALGCFAALHKEKVDPFSLQVNPSLSM